MAQPPAFRRRLGVLLLFAIVAVGALLIIKHGDNQPAANISGGVAVSGDSMEPTLHSGDSVRLVDLVASDSLQRGWVVTYHWPGDENKPNAAVFVKRVVGMPGETIETRDDNVYIDGRRLDEPYLAKGTETKNLKKQVIPTGSYFMLGDNRGHAPDSRVSGPIPRANVLGHVVQLLAPANRSAILP